MSTGKNDPWKNINLVARGLHGTVELRHSLRPSPL